MFQEEHRFNQALKLKHVVPKKQFPGSLTACILNFAFQLLDVGRKGFNDLGHLRIRRADGTLETCVAGEIVPL